MDGPLDALISRSVRLTRRGLMLVAIGLGMTAGGALLHTTAENEARSSHTISEVHQAARRPILTTEAVPATPATALAHADTQGSEQSTAAGFFRDHTEFLRRALFLFAILIFVGAWVAILSTAWGVFPRQGWLNLSLGLGLTLYVAWAMIQVNGKAELTRLHSNVDTELLQPWEIDYGNAQRVVISMQTDKRELASHEVALLERTIADVAAGRLAQASPEAVLAIEMATGRPLRTAIAVDQRKKIEQVRQAKLLGAALLSIIAAMALTVGVVAMTIGQVIDSRLRRIVSLKARACIALHPDRSGS